MARRYRNRQQNGRNGPGGPPNHFNYASEEQPAACQTCGNIIEEYAALRMAPKHAETPSITTRQQHSAMPHRGPCRHAYQSSHRTTLQGRVQCAGCKRRHTGPCRDVVRARLQAGGRDVLLPLRVVAAKVRQRRYGVPERVDHFVREVGSEDTLMCYCDGAESSFCVNHFAEQVARQPQNRNLVITQDVVAGLR